MKRALSILLLALVCLIGGERPTEATTFPFSYWKQNGFNPATLSFDWWQRSQNYPGIATPWPGSASAGTSGSHSNLGSAADLDGTPVNGILTVHFDSGHNSIGTESLDNYIQVGQFSGAVVFNSSTAPPDNGPGSRALNAQLVAMRSQGFLGVSIESVAGTPSCSLWMLSSFIGYVEQTTACSLNVWHAFQFEYDGTNMTMRLDGGTWSTPVAVVSGFNGTALNTLGWLFGTPSYANQNITADIVEGFLSKQLLSITALGDFDNYLSYLRTKYAQPF